VIVVGGSGITFGLSVVKDLVQKDLKGMSRVKAIELIWTFSDPGTFPFHLLYSRYKFKFLPFVAALVPLIPTLTTLIQQSVFTPLRISLHYTRASHTIPPVPSIPGLTISPGRPRIGKIIDYAVSKALSIGVHLDTTDIYHTGPTGGGEVPEKGSNKKAKMTRSQSHRSRDQAAGHCEKETRRKIQVDVEMEEYIAGTREKDDIQRITGVIVGICGPVELATDVVDAIGNVDGKRRDRVGGIEIHEE
jgi:hypothetical protein